MAEIIAFLWRKQFPQLHLYFVGIFAVGQPQSSGDADAMSICYDSRFAVDISADKVGSLSSDTGQLGQFLYRIRDASTIYVP